MPEQSNGAEAAERVRSVHVVGLVSHSLSTDNTTAMIVFRLPDDSEFAITMPVQHLAGVRSGLSALITMVSRRAGNAISRFARSFSVGHTDDHGFVKAPNGKSFAWRDCTLVQVDGGTEDESLYVMTKMDGLKLADSLRDSIMPRLTMQERRELAASKFSGKKLQVPNKGIIVP